MWNGCIRDEKVQKKENGGGMKEKEKNTMENGDFMIVQHTEQSFPKLESLELLAMVLHKFSEDCTALVNAPNKITAYDQGNVICQMFGCVKIQSNQLIEKARLETLEIALQLPHARRNDFIQNIKKQLDQMIEIRGHLLTVLMSNPLRLEP